MILSKIILNPWILWKRRYCYYESQIELFPLNFFQALVIPAFESQRYRSRIPKNKKQLLSMLSTKSVMPFRHDVWAVGHSPTNYTKWKTATSPYNVIIMNILLHYTYSQIFS